MAVQGRYIFKNCNFMNLNFFMNTYGDKFYIKVVDFVEIYNFVVQTFFI
jgi:hypothetical protein